MHLHSRAYNMLGLKKRKVYILSSRKIVDCGKVVIELGPSYFLWGKETGEHTEKLICMIFLGSIVTTYFYYLALVGW